MKKRIICGLCLFFALMSVLVLVPLSAAAQSGHGGSTQVIARILQSSDEQSEPESSVPEPSDGESSPPDDEPVSTGDGTFALAGLVTAAAVFSLGLMIVVWKNGSDSD